MRNHREIKSRIADLAREKFLTSGFIRVSMDEIARELGVSKKTLYRYYPSKMALLREVSGRINREIELGVDRILADKKIDFIERLRQMSSFIALKISKVGRPLLHDVRRYAPEIWKQIDEWRHKRIQVNFGNLLFEGMKRGIFKRDLDQKLLLLIYTTLIERIISPDVLSELPLSASQAFDTIIRVIYEGILTDKARAQYGGRHISQASKGA